MKLLTARKVSMVANSVFVAFLAFAAHGAANVFDDAAFWFRGGKDLSGDGYMQTGEFFDDLQANDNNHANHKMSMSNFTGDYKSFKENAAFQNEQVVFPALGTTVEKVMQVLRISNAGKKLSGTTYYYPLVINPRSVFASNNISNEYTVVSRIRMDEDGLNREECFLKLGYNSSARQGMMLGFAKYPASASETGARYIKGNCTPDSASNNTSFQFDIRIPTNTWVDVAVVVGNGKLRVGVAAPESLATHANNPTIAFAETPMWTDNCPLLEDGYRLFCFTGQSAPATSSSADQTCFLGSVQQIAIWGRALSDQEVMAAFGMPRPAIFRTGFDNGSSNEFGGTRSGPSQEIDGLGSWQSVANTMEAGDTWAVNFTALRDEAGLPQIFSIKSLGDSETVKIEPVLSNASHNVSLGERRVASNGRTFWPVPANLVAEGANTLVIKRKNDGAGTFKMDAMELGGSLGVGKETGSITDDQRVYPERIATGVPSAADPNTQHWPVGLQPYVGITNLHFRVWVDPDVVGRATSRFWTHTQCKDRSSTYVIQGDEEFTLYVNGTQKATRDCGTSWEETELTFLPGELKGGWNDFEFISLPYTTCHWLFGYYRFETVLSHGFGLPPRGLSVIVE